MVVELLKNSELFHNNGENMLCMLLGFNTSSKICQNFRSVTCFEAG